MVITGHRKVVSGLYQQDPSSLRQLSCGSQFLDLNVNRTGSPQDELQAKISPHSKTHSRETVPKSKQVGSFLQLPPPLPPYPQERVTCDHSECCKTGQLRPLIVAKHTNWHHTRLNLYIHILLYKWKVSWDTYSSKLHLLTGQTSFRVYALIIKYSPRKVCLCKLCDK